MASIRGLPMVSDVKLLSSTTSVRPRSALERRHGSRRPRLRHVGEFGGAAGTSGLITVYAGGDRRKLDAPNHAGASEPFVDEIAHDEAPVPGPPRTSTAGLRRPVDARPLDDGAYAAFGTGQYTRFWGGTAQADGNVHFAGRPPPRSARATWTAASRAATEPPKRFSEAGVPVPRALANLPH